MSLDEEFELIVKRLIDDKDLNRFYHETRRFEQTLLKDPSLLSLENQLDLCYNNGYYFYGIAYDPEAAIEYFNRAWEHAISLNPSGLYLTSINDVKLKVKSALGYAHLANGNNDKALENYKESLFWATTRNAEGDHPLYSYREVNKYLLQDIINKEITVVSPKLFNDPLDCPIFSILKRYQVDEAQNTREIWEKAYSYFKIRSFVSNERVKDKSRPFSKEIDNTELEKENCKFLMWSHYAKDHTGICIKYRIDARFLEKDEENNIASIIYDVDYEKSLEPSKEPTQTFRQAFATKNICWKYENEVRLIHYDPSCSADFKSLPLGEYTTIEVVYFGLKCSPKDKKTIRGILKEDVAYFQMKEDEEDIFKLVEEPLNDRAKAMLEATREVETLG